MGQATPYAATATLGDNYLHLSAYNAAFWDLGLRFRWDIDTFTSLSPIEGEKARIAAYIKTFHPHLLKAYDADFLSELIFQKKDEYYQIGVTDSQRKGESASAPLHA